MATHFLEESAASIFMFYFKIQQYSLAENLSHQVLQKLFHKCTSILHYTLPNIHMNLFFISLIQKVHKLCTIFFYCVFVSPWIYSLVFLQVCYRHYMYLPTLLSTNMAAFIKVSWNVQKAHDWGHLHNNLLINTPSD